jgi:hypothetical protein
MKISGEEDEGAEEASAGGGQAGPRAPSRGRRGAASGVVAAARGCGDGRELAVGTRARAAVRGRARGRAPRAGGGDAALPRLGRSRAHRLRLLPRATRTGAGPRYASRPRASSPCLPPTSFTGSFCQFAGGSGILDVAA